MKPPRISIVTASFNQARYIRETIESVLAQSYADVEHIIVDGMSSDDTPLILGAYPRLKVVREPDRGQADAINKGFRIATGDVFGFFNSDDTFLPGALERVIAEIDPVRGRHVVMGRCRFVDERGRFTGPEHPSAFEGHARVLEIWKGHSLPQPAVFFTREAWERSGPLDVGEHLVLDYDLFCRMSRFYRFHPVDQVFATYRLHGLSKSASVSDERRLVEAVRVSRKYWGPWHHPRRWRLEASFLAYRADRRGRAAKWLRRAQDERSHGRILFGVAPALAGSLIGPDVLLDTVFMPRLRSLFGGVSGRIRPLRLLRARDRPETTGWREFRGVHRDGWAGPELITEVDVQPGHRELVLEGVLPWPSSARIDVYVDGVLCGSQKVKRKGNFGIRFPTQLSVGLHEIRVTSSSWFVPDDFTHSGDFRPLAFQVAKLTLEPAAK
jgi:glycosyltransferase involved in cell wall biosynthesis